MDNSFLFQTLNDNPDNIRIINESLYDIKASLFKNLYDAQYGLTDVYQTVIDFATLRVVDPATIAFDINFGFIDERNRIEFKKSKYYKRRLHSSELFEVSKLFSRCVLVFINGKMTNNFYLYIDDDKVQIIFKRYHSARRNIPNDGLFHHTINDYKREHAKMCVLFMPICRIRSGRTTYGMLKNANYTLHPDDGYLDPEVVAHQGGDYPLLLMGTTATADIHKNGVSYNPMSVEIPIHSNLITSDSYELETSDHKLLTLSNGELKLASSNIIMEDSMIITEDTFPYSDSLRDTVINVEMLYPKNILTVKDVDSDGWFDLPIMDTPIPKENILVFKKSKTSSMELLYGDDMLSMYYPNIYKINAKSDYGFKIYVFYYNDIHKEFNQHTNELNLYHSFVDALPHYKDGSISDYIKTYKPVEMAYSISDYSSVSDEETTLEYKIRKLREVIKQNPDLYKYYLRRFNDRYPCIWYTVEKDTYKDRLRTDTSRELDITYVFDEERYVFSISTDYMGELSMFFIDNLYYFPDAAYVHNGYIYIYIPTSMLQIGSTLHMCKLYNNTMTKTMVVDSSIPNKIEIDERYRATAEDLYITYNDGTKEAYITEGYKLCEKIDNGRIIREDDIIIDDIAYRPVDETIFYKYKELYLIFDDNTYNGQTITIRSDKRTLVFDTMMAFSNVIINSNINRDKRNFLIYRDGRLMSSYAAKYKFSEDSNGPHNIQSLLLSYEDTVIKTIHSSEKYNLVCEYNDEEIKHLRVYQKYLDTSEEIYDREGNIYDNQINSSIELGEAIRTKGTFIDLTNFLTKPLSFEWYDIYLNGLKLTEKDVIFISPYQLILTITDDYPDIDSFIVVDLIGFIREYVVPLPFINPDLIQITDDMIRDYPEVMDENLNVIFDGDKIRTMTANILLNPDVSDGFELH